MTTYTGDFHLSFTVAKRDLGDVLIQINGIKALHGLAIRPIEISEPRSALDAAPAPHKPRSPQQKRGHLPDGTSTRDFLLAAMRGQPGDARRDYLVAEFRSHGFTPSAVDKLLAALVADGLIVKVRTTAPVTYRMIHNVETAT